MDYLSIYTLKMIGELSRDSVERDVYDSLSSDLAKAVDTILKKYGMEILGDQMMSHDLDVEYFSKCEICSCWVINRNKEKDREEVDEFIKDGGESNGQVLCLNCLPESHAWSWKNI